MRPAATVPSPRAAAEDPALRVVLVLTGPHGAGKSRHAATLALLLSQRGLDVALVAHPSPPAGLGAWGRALHYAAFRATLLAGCASRVIVADRWTESTRCAAEWAPEGERGDMRVLAGFEDRQHGAAVYHLLLDASDATLDARLRGRRGRPATEAEREEARYLRTRFDARVVHTDRDEHLAAADVLSWAEDVLGVGAEGGA